MKNGIYFKLQLKKAFKIYPAILLISVLTIGVVALGCSFMLERNRNDASNNKLSIGIVGEVGNTGIGIAVEALQKMDSSRFAIDFVECDEETAQKKLKSEELIGYIKIPDDFIEDIYVGKNTPAQFVTLNTPDNFGSVVMEEIALVISDIITESQNGIYSVQRVNKLYGNNEKYHQITERINLAYIAQVLGRGNSYKEDILGISDAVSMGGYYVCGIILFLLLMWGISCHRLLGSKNITLAKKLKIAGLSHTKQMLCEYAVYLLITVITMVIFAVLFGAIIGKTNFGIKELSGVGIVQCVSFVLLMMPVVVMVTAMHTAFYEICSGTVSRILLLLMVSLGLGYISGCFYPDYFFPKTVQIIGKILPSGVGFSYIKSLMSSTLTILDFLWCVLYSVLFGAGAILIRNKRIAGERL